jgi:nitrous oxide reductase accessory protein NosL
MKKHLLLLVVAIGLLMTGIAYGQANEDIHLHKDCKYCGMDRGKFDFSRMLIEYDDGSSIAVCSIHCAAVDLANNIDKTPKAIKVGDFTTKNLIDAEKAFWVIGGSKPGVMSKRGKWAFARKEDAESFIATNGGSLADFEAAMKAAYEDMYADTKMIRDKRKMNRTKQSTGSGHQH